MTLIMVARSQANHDVLIGRNEDQGESGWGSDFAIFERPGVVLRYREVCLLGSSRGIGGSKRGLVGKGRKTKSRVWRFAHRRYRQISVSPRHDTFGFNSRLKEGWTSTTQLGGGRSQWGSTFVASVLPSKTDHAAQNHGQIPWLWLARQPFHPHSNTLPDALHRNVKRKTPWVGRKEGVAWGSTGCYTLGSWPQGLAVMKSFCYVCAF